MNEDNQYYSYLVYTSYKKTVH